MAESVVSIAAERLADLLIQEAKFLHGVSGQIELIQLELELMQKYLEDADKRQIQDQRVQTWISKIRETAYDVEDILETFLLKIASRRRGGIKNAFKRYACILNEAAELHKVGSQIEATKTRITTLTRCLQTYGIKHIREGEEGPSSVIERQQQWRQSYSHEVEEYTVGLDENIKNLVKQLVNEERCRAVSICGMGGLGKTTLAKKVYHHQDIRRRFDGLAWAFVSQQFQPRNVWEGILFNITSPSDKEREKIKGLRDEEVAEKLYQVQRERKYLVILDDIWDKDAWESLRHGFPLGNSGSKILLTTRNKEVAEHVDPTCFLLELQPLNEEEGWDLLRNKAFPSHYGCSKPSSERFPFNIRQYLERLVLTASQRISLGYLGLPKKKKALPEGTDGEIDEDMKKLGAEMVKRCGGLPLAIVVLGGILATKHKDEWKMVNNQINSYLTRGKGHETQQLGVREILALSYYELPYQLKPCFLYLGHFPEDCSIPTKKLMRMWVAEGLVSPMQYEVKGAETLEEIAECFLEELLNRNMVQVGAKGSTGRVKTCRLHDLMRDLCLLKANEENFLEIFVSQDGNELMGGSLSSNVTSAKLSQRIRRIAIMCKEDDDENIFLKSERTRYLRSLLFTSTREYGTYLENMIFELCNFKLLKVLDLQEGVIQKLPRAIGDLVHLRYLSLTFFGIIKKSIPSSIGNLRCLQTLIIGEGDPSPMFFFLEVPNIIWKMEQLRHLCLPYCEKENSVKLGLGNLRELQTLEFFDARNFDVKEFTKLTNLRTLEIVELRSLKELEGALLSDILNGLRSLGIGFDSRAEETDLQRLLLSCHQLRKLFLGGKIVKLPEYSKFPPNLTKLSLAWSRLEEDPMPTLEKLPNLTLLRLYRNSYAKQMTCSANGFPQLKSLQLNELLHLEEWCVQEEAMRSLCKLEIKSCDWLKMVPDGLRFITTLRELHIIKMPQEFQKRVKEGGEDSDKLKHVPSIIVK